MPIVRAYGTFNTTSSPNINRVEPSRVELLSKPAIHLPIRSQV